METSAPADINAPGISEMLIVNFFSMLLLLCLLMWGKKMRDIIL